MQTGNPQVALATPSTPAPTVAKARAKAGPKTVRPAAKVSAKAAARPAPSAKSGNGVATRKAAAQSTAAEKPAKAKKVKMVRDSFTFPKAEFVVLDDLKQRAITLSAPVKKTELIRAGIKALAAMEDANFLAAIRAVPSLKTGRPAKS